MSVFWLQLRRSRLIKQYYIRSFKRLLWMHVLSVPTLMVYVQYDTVNSINMETQRRSLSLFKVTHR